MAKTSSRRLYEYNHPDEVGSESNDSATVSVPNYEDHPMQIGKADGISVSAPGLQPFMGPGRTSTP